LTTGSRTRINLTGALNLERMEIFTRQLIASLSF